MFLMVTHLIEASPAIRDFTMLYHNCHSTKMNLPRRKVTLNCFSMGRAD